MSTTSIIASDLARLLSALPPLTFTNTIVAVLVIILGGIFYQVVWKYYTLPYKNLPGPWNWNPLLGSLGPVISAEPGQKHREWIKQYGHAMYYPGFLYEPRFFSTDPHALQYILSHADDFPKSEGIRRTLADILGKGVLFAEGDDHRRQRKIMNPAFAPNQIRDNHTPIFLNKAYELKDVLNKLITETSETSTQSAQIDVWQWLGKTTLDVIGLAGFDYDFASLSHPDNELAQAFNRMFAASTTVNFMAIVQSIIPGLNLIPTKRTRLQRASLATTRRIGKKLVEQKKQAAQGSTGVGVQNGGFVGKDLLSIVVRANMAPDLKESQRMTDEEMLGQITTFMLAGQETSSTALNWGLYMLSLHQDVQEKLREELLAVQEDMPSMDTLNSLEYLDAFVHEVLRLLAPVPSTRRDSVVDAVIPLGKPVKGRDGKMMNSVFLPKGTAVIIPILNVNTSEDLWGPDAWEFRPSRWLKKPDGQPANPVSEPVPGVWGHLMTFIGGPRACIGYRFALVEIKAILFVLVRNFVFEPCEPAIDIEKKTSLVTRPVIRSEKEKGAQMPLMVRAVA